MAVMVKEGELVGTKGQEKTLALCDRGAPYSCIRPELAAGLEVIMKLAKPLSCETLREKEVAQVIERVGLDSYLDGYRFSDELLVIPNLSENLVIAAATLQKWRLKLDFEHEEVIINPRVTRLRLG